jgi:hypothetical protein
MIEVAVQGRMQLVVCHLRHPISSHHHKALSKHMHSFDIHALQLFNLEMTDKLATIRIVEAVE